VVLACAEAGNGRNPLARGLVADGHHCRLRYEYDRKYPPTDTSTFVLSFKNKALSCCGPQPRAVLVSEYRLPVGIWPPRSAR